MTYFPSLTQGRHCIPFSHQLCVSALASVLNCFSVCHLLLHCASNNKLLTCFYSFCLLEKFIFSVNWMGRTRGTLLLASIPGRLAVRSSDFHPGCSGSTPGQRGLRSCFKSVLTAAFLRSQAFIYIVTQRGTARSDLALNCCLIYIMLISIYCASRILCTVSMHCRLHTWYGNLWI